MRLSFFSGLDRIEIRDRTETDSGRSEAKSGIYGDDACVAKVDLRETWQVESFVRRYFQGAGEVHRLRSLLSGWVPVTHFLGDEEVLRQLSRGLQSGTLCAYSHPRPPTAPVRQPGTVAGKTVAREAPRSTSPAPLPRTPIELVMAPPVSRERIDAAQDVEAAMLEDAAKSATPFCEECERARLQRPGQG